MARPGQNVDITTKKIKAIFLSSLGCIILSKFNYNLTQLYQFISIFILFMNYIIYLSYINRKLNKKNKNRLKKRLLLSWNSYNLYR